MPHAPWLLTAPPWLDGAPADRERITPITTRKRQFDELTDAETNLGKWAMRMAGQVWKHGWRQMLASVRGKSNLNPKVRTLQHKAARLLDHLRLRGAAVPLCTHPWTADQHASAFARGPHQSSRGEREFVCQEMLDFCQQGYWIVVP